MKLSKITLILAAIFLSAFLSACSGSRFAATSWPGLTASGDTIYVASGPHIYAIDMDGKETWKYPVERDNAVSFFAAPVLTDDGQLIAGGYDHVLYSLDPDNGTENWRFDEAVSRYISSVLVEEDGIFAPNDNGDVFALERDGTLKWVSSVTSKSIWGNPVVDTEELFFGSLDHSFYSINRENGNKSWAVDLGTSIAGSPTYSDGIIYIGTFGSKFYALDERNGDEKWALATQDWIWAGSTIHEGVIYFGDISGNLYAVDIGNGRIIWDRPTDGAIFGAPLIFEDIIYVGTESGSIYAMNLDGSPRWNKTFDENGKIYGSPLVVGENIIFASLESENLITAIDTNGNFDWNYTPEN